MMMKIIKMKDGIFNEKRMTTRTVSEQRIKCHARMDMVPTGDDVSCIYLI